MSFKAYKYGSVYKQTINKWIEILNEAFIRFKC